MKHKNKLKIARRMNNGLKKNAFITPQWESRKKGIESKVKKNEAHAKEVSKLRKERLKKLK